METWDENTEFWDKVKKENWKSLLVRYNTAYQDMYNIIMSRLREHRIKR